MAELTVAADENVMYAHGYAADLASRLTDRLARNQELLRSDLEKRTRIVLTIDQEYDPETHEIVTDVSLVSRERVRFRLPGIPVGSVRQLEMYGAGLLRSEE